MREPSKDLRIIRTKEFIREALIDLIEEKGFEAITVKDITTRARINRGTFYAHYQDKFDLMARCQEEFMDKMRDIVKQKVTDVNVDADSNVPPTLPLNVMVSMFEYLDQNRKFMRAVSGPKGGLSFQTKMKEFLWNTLFVRKEFPLVKQEKLLVPSEYLIAYLVSAHIGVIEQWLNGNGTESPEEMARILATITVKGPFTAAGLKN
ncbi:transcriptional regulator, TetR family protein [Paenibacillus vortex V453]|jgi:AcrR family transcriptional regulator|uniref:TetR family transcriptional regulator n=2 Tax=Paenibacillus TaxID=44249 RepID=A0A163DJU3_9BACL|nr:MULTISPECIES: TetR/AcrR family transcriptional regulator [Paenibacillus]MCA4752274.1 TetR/AcrR family transcriptional regulator [Mycolicibacterium fortuitum]AVV58345.1 TetR/AcrR family transcriptional regulator [Paenibacillus glucanolyticus]AWP27507.1 TetR family transcriptional regulator [Paenibacillus sp. Cedars]EFU40734.1 transcriptional regulator, TetR family protein [Paenibacillus vortex V453]ETT42560.1 TetR family transcriptional regulator [Paenibacillus sp. FSL R5-808]